MAAVAPDSRVAAELAHRVQAIVVGASGCGFLRRVTSQAMTPVSWHQVPPAVPGDAPWAGTFGEVAFRARYERGLRRHT